MRTNKKVNFKKVTQERTDRAEISIAVVNNPKTVSRELLERRGAEAKDFRRDCDGKKVFATVIRDIDFGYYVVLDAHDDIETNIRTIWKAVTISCEWLSEMFSRKMLFAKLLLAAFGKEVA